MRGARTGYLLWIDMHPMMNGVCPQHVRLLHRCLLNEGLRLRWKGMGINTAWIMKMVCRLLFKTSSSNYRLWMLGNVPLDCLRSECLSVRPLTESLQENNAITASRILKACQHRRKVFRCLTWVQVLIHWTKLNVLTLIKVNVSFCSVFRTVKILNFKYKYCIENGT